MDGKELRRVLEEVIGWASLEQHGFRPGVETVAVATALGVLADEIRYGSQFLAHGDMLINDTRPAEYVRNCASLYARLLAPVPGVLILAETDDREEALCVYRLTRDRFPRLTDSPVRLHGYDADPDPTCEGKWPGDGKPGARFVVLAEVELSSDERWAVEAFAAGVRATWAERKGAS